MKELASNENRKKSIFTRRRFTPTYPTFCIDIDIDNGQLPHAFHADMLHRVKRKVLNKLFRYLQCCAAIYPRCHFSNHRCTVLVYYRPNRRITNSYTVDIDMELFPTTDHRTAHACIIVPTSDDEHLNRCNMSVIRKQMKIAFINRIMTKNQRRIGETIFFFFFSSFQHYLSYVGLLMRFRNLSLVFSFRLLIESARPRRQK